MVDFRPIRFYHTKNCMFQGYTVARPIQLQARGGAWMTDLTGVIPKLPLKSKAGNK